MNLIYSCVFFNKDYINLVNLLLISYILYGNPKINTDYLIICHPEFQNKIQKIYDELKIKGKIWCLLNIDTLFKAGYARLNIFDYPNIKNYTKILYLDCDILITNNLSNILEISLEDKLYVLKEGNTNHNFWGNQFFKSNPNLPAFTSGIQLYNNCITIKKLYNDIKQHIKEYLKKNKSIPICLEQPFIVYHAISKKLYNNTKLINTVVNNPSKFNNETISHFPGGPGNYKSKIPKMTIYMNDIMMNIKKNINIPKISISQLKYKNILNNLDIYDDIWTCSNEFREDIKLFFQNKPKYSIVEIGSYRGYTTRYLSNLFHKVIAVDNSAKWIKLNKNYNCDKKNIEYINLDIYKESWNVIPEVEVIFIDASHDYNSCKADIINSIKRFKSIKYIIFDDYGVWKGVKQIVDEYLNKHILIFEKYIGLNNIPGPNNIIIKDSTEGIICKVNPIINKKYKWKNSIIEFIENDKISDLGTYKFIDNYLLKITFNNQEYLLKFNTDFSNFIAIRKGDFEITSNY